MATRFKTDIHGGRGWRLLAILQGINLSMRATETVVIALPDDATIPDEDGSDNRVRLDSTSATLGQVQG